MLKLVIFCLTLVFFAEAMEPEDGCLIAYLKQRKLLNATTYWNYASRTRVKNCDQIVKKIVKTLYEESFDYLDEDASVDNKTYRHCMKGEFDRHQLDLKFLKAKLFETEPEQLRLEKIRDNLVRTIKLNCSKTFESDASVRFKSFISDDGGLSAKLARHPAILKMKANLVCMNSYAVDKELLDAGNFSLKLTPLKLTDEDCKKVVDEVKQLIIEEWHIRRYSEDDEVNRCRIEILLRTQAIDLFIKNVLLSQLQLTQEQKELEHENFLKNSNAVHEMTYKCMSIGFEKI